MVNGLGKRLQYLRIRAGLTQREAASIPEIACDPRVLAAYENDNRSPKPSMIIRFAQYYGVTTDYLLGISPFENSDHLRDNNSIQLSKEALQFLERCDSDVLITLNLMLSVPSSNLFLLTLRKYIEDYDIDEKGILQNDEHRFLYEKLRKDLSIEAFSSLLETWAWDSFSKATKQLIKEIREQMDIENGLPRGGRPKKYKTGKKKVEQKL